ncbi:MAG: hypothetical protein K2X60_02360 [Xanthobacteraceae bacterium]|nr:hypothetical protein [Xanthobacteraceae bacterium]
MGEDRNRELDEKGSRLTVIDGRASAARCDDSTKPPPRSDPARFFFALLELYEPLFGRDIPHAFLRLFQADLYAQWHTLCSVCS